MSSTDKKFEEGGSFSPTYTGYERPMSPYVCGRGATWGRPCAHGANPNGSCGGTTECTPFKKGDRWECRRPASSGGPCTEGPLPQGACSHGHPPCAPRPSLRTSRGRVAKMAIGAVIALIAGMLNFNSGQMLSIDPGPLSHKHQNFVRKDPKNPADRGCVSCHAAHEQGAVGWLKAVFQPANQTAQCTHCHKFGTDRDDDPGRKRAAELARSAHNNDSPEFGGKPGVMKTECTMCHMEHGGARASLVKMNDQQCNTCHSKGKQIKGFAADHPPFPDNFPHTDHKSYWFNHEKHFKTHFKTNKALAPSSCTNCHNISGAERAVKPASFGKMCASCHSDTISKMDDAERDLMLLNMPKLDYSELPEDQRPMVSASPSADASPEAAPSPAEPNPETPKPDEGSKGASPEDAKKAKEAVDAKKTAFRVKQTLADTKAKDAESKTKAVEDVQKKADEKKAEAEKLRKEADEKKAEAEKAKAGGSTPDASASPSPDASPAAEEKKEEKKGKKGRRGKKAKDEPKEEKKDEPKGADADKAKELEEAAKKADEAATKAEEEAKKAASEAEPLKKEADEATQIAAKAKEEATQAETEVKDAEAAAAKLDSKPGSDADKKAEDEKKAAADKKAIEDKRVADAKAKVAQAAKPSMVVATCPSEMENMAEAMTFLLGVKADDPKSYNAPVFELLKELTNSEPSEEGTGLEKRIREVLAKQNAMVLAALDADVKSLTGEAKRARLVAVLREFLDTEGMEIAERLLVTVDKENPPKPDDKLNELYKKWFGDDALRTSQALGRLLRGLNREVLVYAATNWITKSKECEGAGNVKLGTWYTDAFTIRYKASGHADPVVKSWIEWSIVSERLAKRAAQAKGADADKAKIDVANATALREKFTKNDGPGQCLKCHVIEKTGAGDATQYHITWPFNREVRSPHFYFAHAPHLSFLVQKEGAAAKAEPVVDKAAEPKDAAPVDRWATEGCVTCHTMVQGQTAGAEPKSNFSHIKKETCLECHNVSQVRQDCQLCHRYHRDRGFTPQFRADFRQRLEDRAARENAASAAPGAPAAASPEATGNKPTEKP